MFDLLSTVATGQLPADTSSIEQLALWDTALRLAASSASEPVANSAPRRINLILLQAGRESFALSGPFARLAAPLQQATSEAELSRILAALAMEPSTDQLLREGATLEPTPPLVHLTTEQARISAYLAGTGKVVFEELRRVAQGEVLASVRQGKPIPHREILGLKPAALVYRPDVPPEVAEELVLVREGHISTQALIGTYYRDTPGWIRESLASHSLRGLRAMLKLLDSAGYQVRQEALPEAERLGALEDLFAATRAYRDAERQEALAVLAARRKERAS